MGRASDVLLYLVDVGVPSPRNTALGELQLASDILPRGGELELQVNIGCLGAGGTQAAELYLEQQDPQLPIVRDGRVELPPTELRGKQLAELTEDETQTVAFRLGSLPIGTSHGAVRLAAQDGLAVDNQRYFTIEVQEASPVLVLAPPGVVTRFLTEAIAPYEYRETGRARYDCTVREQADLVSLSLEQYRVVCLVDPGPLTPPDWTRLRSFVEGGGGLALFLGHNADPSSFNDPAALSVLGGKLIRRWRSPGDLHLRLDDLSHPVTAAFREVATSVPWSNFPIYRHWVLEELTPQTRPVMTYTNGKPAVLEVALGRGRCLVMTTPVSDPLQQKGRSAWNELPTGEDAWPFFVLANEVMRYLAATQGSRLNFTVGETAVIRTAASGIPTATSCSRRWSNRRTWWRSTTGCR